MEKITAILKRRSFLAIFITQVFGAFNDNLFRTSLALFVTYKVADVTPEHKKVMVALAVGVFMLPYFLFSAMAGEIADKHRKDVIFKATKAMEVVIALLAVLGFYLHNPYMLLCVLFLMGLQSTLFGPAKYSVLPDILREDELIAGNGLFEAGTYMAILSGTIIGGLVISGSDSSLIPVCASVVAIAATGFAASLFIPQIKAAAPETGVSLNFIKSTFSNMKFVAKSSPIRLCILGISWFWLVGAVIVAQIPAFAESVLFGTPGLLAFLLTLFSCGVGIGAIVCQSLLKGEVTSKYVPFSAILMTVFLVDLAVVSSGFQTPEQRLAVVQFLSTFAGLRITVDMSLLAFCGGLFMVPLNAMLQVFAEEKTRSRVIAANNIINALFMVVGSIACAALLANGMAIPGVFAVIACANALVTVFICGLLPQHIVRALFKRALTLMYDIEIKGLENFKNAKNNTVIICNHTSFIDAALLWIYLPGDVYFAANTNIVKEWWVKPLLRFVRHIALDPINPMGVKVIIDEVKKGNKVVIFPEGRITTTGSLMKVYPGPAIIADKSDADILPIWIEGSQYSMFGRFSRRFKKSPNSGITITVFPATKLSMPDNVDGKDRRLLAVNLLHTLMCQIKMKSCSLDCHVFDSLVAAMSLAGRSKHIVEDIARKPLSYGGFVAAAFALGAKMRAKTGNGEYIGLMLPNSVPAAVSFFGLQIYGRVPCMLNFSSGSKSLLSCCKAAKIRTVFTSLQFVALAGLESSVAALKEKDIEVIFLEDLRKEIDFIDRLAAWGKSFKPLSFAASPEANDPCVVLFTSGSEGVPKGVVLSHRNIQANCRQLASVVDFGLLDIFFNAMPVFHSFGLTGGLLLPLLSGIKTFMYPSPLHYRIVPELVYDTNATVLFGTDTFLASYAKTAHPYDFHDIRIALAGAEKLKDETFTVWFEKFGIRLLDGYGATEASPGIAVNIPMEFKRGTVGRLLPLIESRLQPVPGLEDGGRLFIKGPNIMLGYLKADKPGVLQPPKDGWYDTGDIVSFDDQGFMTIKGRAKRFAKIAGEMVSLSAVEDALHGIWKTSSHAVTSVPDEKKGEQLVLFTTRAKTSRADIAMLFKKQGISELSVPKTVVVLEEIPLMGTGKTDYVKLGEMAAKQSC